MIGTSVLFRGEHITSVQVAKFSVPLHWFNITTMMKAWLNETRGSVGPGLWQGKEMFVVKEPIFLIFILISSPVFATKQDTQDKPVMNIFEIGVRLARDKDFADVARQTISASVDHEEGTLAMYALQHSDNPRQAFMVELYENEIAYRKHLNAAPYKAFAARAPDIIDRKNKITLEPQFLGDKHIIPNERTINNLVIVEVTPEFHNEFKNIVLPEMAESLKVEKGVLAMYAATDSQTHRLRTAGISMVRRIINFIDKRLTSVTISGKRRI